MLSLQIQVRILSRMKEEDKEHILQSEFPFKELFQNPLLVVSNYIPSAPVVSDSYARVQRKLKNTQLPWTKL